MGLGITESSNILDTTLDLAALVSPLPTLSKCFWLMHCWLDALIYNNYYELSVLLYYMIIIIIVNVREPASQKLVVLY